MPRFLGIDYGTKRIGLAVSDPEATMASPLTTVQSRGDVAQDVVGLAAVVQEYEIDELVVGLPLNMDGTEGKQAKITRAFGEALNRQTDLPVHYCDERLSSFTAEELLRPAELTRKKKKARLDRVAAQVMLQAFLDARSTG
jgi:putative Holliday junction resolvase